MHPIPHMLSYLRLCKEANIGVLKSELHILATVFLKVKFTNLFKPIGQQYPFLAFTLPSQRTDILRVSMIISGQCCWSCCLENVILLLLF